MTSTLPWWRRVLPVIQSHRVAFSLAIGLSFVSLVFQVLVPNMLGGDIDHLSAHHGSLHHDVLLIVLVGVLAGIAGIVSRQFLYSTAYNVEADLRSLIYEHLTWLSFSFYDRVQSGQLISRANSDIRSVQMYSTFAPLIIVQCFIGVIAFGFMLYDQLDPGARGAHGDADPLLRRHQDAPGDVPDLVGHPGAPRRGGDRRRRERERRARRQVLRPGGGRDRPAWPTPPRSVAWAYIKDANIRAIWSPWVQNLPQLGLALVLFFGGWMVLHGDLQHRRDPRLQPVPPDAPGAVHDARPTRDDGPARQGERRAHLRDPRREPRDRRTVPAPTTCSTSRAPSTSTTSTSPTTTAPSILRDFDAHLAPGETVALVGRTGSGKSTVARLLTRFYDVTGGVGHDRRPRRARRDARSLRENVGVVLDEPFLFSVSIRDNIAYGRPEATLEEVEAAAKAANADEFIIRLPEGYDTVVGERGYTLSGGQRQRIAIARTLLLNPPVLILDDATSAIDVHVESGIYESLRTLLAQRTTIVIAHRISTIALATRVLLLDEGRVVASGTHEELLATVPLYSEILAQTTSGRSD